MLECPSLGLFKKSFLKIDKNVIKESDHAERSITCSWKGGTRSLRNIDFAKRRLRLIFQSFMY